MIYLNIRPKKCRSGGDLIATDPAASYEPGLRMNMTPRSVSMGNKVYKLHVRCGALKETWDMSPDAPVLEFQNRVLQKFQVWCFWLQCCGSGSGPFWSLDRGSGWVKTGKSESGSGIWIRDAQPGSYFLGLRNHFFGLKYLNSLMRIRDPAWRKFGSGINIPDPQHWLAECFCCASTSIRIRNFLMWVRFRIYGSVPVPGRCLWITDPDPRIRATALWIGFYSFLQRLSRCPKYVLLTTYRYR